MAEEKSELVVMVEQLFKKLIKIMQNLTAIVFMKNFVLHESMKMMNLTQPENHKAVLMQSCEELQEEACQQCKDDYESFTDCVVIAGCFEDACVGCHVNSMMKQCLFWTMCCELMETKESRLLQWKKAMKKRRKKKKTQRNELSCMFTTILILAHQQFTAAAKASSALVAVMAAFTDLYAEKVGLEEVESIDERVGVADLNNEGEEVAGDADDVIEDLVHQHEWGADDVTAGGLPNLDDLVGQIAGNVKQQLLRELQENGVKK
ncbi:hypothetical protein PRK78_004020 [Emydomyces testavorans]|uniref:Uncharacterized protein n=1 Tax=Emydomyces testavorans TaxID=2070801 RepID=A0AAF0DJ52_9EURO|nr:hypothetical protein PRK78_004020 [Emydomyces testavorans]